VAKALFQSETVPFCLKAFPVHRRNNPKLRIISPMYRESQCYTPPDTLTLVTMVQQGQPLPPVPPPHIIRSVWATEWIRKTHGDFYTAAIMLNDRLETVIATYAHLLEEDVAEKAYRLLEECNRQGK
jgi:hypothetical protein